MANQASMSRVSPVVSHIWQHSLLTHMLQPLWAIPSPNVPSVFQLMIFVLLFHLPAMPTTTPLLIAEHFSLRPSLKMYLLRLPVTAYPRRNPSDILGQSLISYFLAYIIAINDFI